MIGVCLAVGGLLLAMPAPAEATDGHFLHGVGAVNSAMGGAGVAAPRSLLGAFYLNPAGLMGFEGTRVEFSFEMFKPDRTVSSTVPTPTPGVFLSGSTRSKSEWVPIPAMGFSTKLANDRVAVGLGGLGIGGFGVDYSGASVAPPGIPSNPILAPRPSGFGQVYSNYQLLKITPAVAVAASSKLWLGAALNINWASLAVDPMPVAAPAFDPGPDSTPGTPDDRAFYSRATAADGAFGFGVQLGAIYRLNDLFAIGAAFTSEQKFQDFSFNSVFENPNLPTFGTPRTITFGLNVPMVLAAGVALDPLPNLSLGFDFRYMFYEDTEGFKVPASGPFRPDGSVAGFAWENIYAIAAGAEYRVSDRVALRGGYNYSQNPIPDAQAMINIPAPAIVKHHATFGLGVRASRRIEISAAYYKAFKNKGTGPVIGPTGPVPGSAVTNALSEQSLLVQFSFSTRGSGGL
jgi:long-chain fatty acid transport protein